MFIDRHSHKHTTTQQTRVRVCVHVRACARVAGSTNAATHTTTLSTGFLFSCHHGLEVSRSLSFCLAHCAHDGYGAHCAHEGYGAHLRRYSRTTGPSSTKAGDIVQPSGTVPRSGDPHLAVPHYTITHNDVFRQL